MMLSVSLIKLCGNDFTDAHFEVQGLYICCNLLGRGKKSVEGFENAEILLIFVKRWTVVYIRCLRFENSTWKTTKVVI